jgi:hypothetical protein
MRFLTLLFATAVYCSAGVTTIRVPDGGIQPQVVEKDGIVHLLYFSGAAEKGDLYYVTSHDYGQTFSKPLRVNQTSRSAMAVGNIRGAQLAIGKNGRVHVAWNGMSATPSPMLYARLNDAGTAFEPERNVIHSSYGLDGGGSLAADSQGGVYIFWHAPLPGTKGEQNRRVWLAKSADEGRTFQPERVAFDNPVGACGCCGMKAYADDAGAVHVLFRAADKVVNRDIWLLTSTDHGQTFTGTDVSRWNIGACVMSSEFFTAASGGLFAAWESEKQAYFGRVVNGKVEKSIAAPGTPVNRKYPVIAGNARGETLFAWTEGMAWKKGGTAAWHVYDKDGNPEVAGGKAEGVPVWSLVAAFARPDGGFVVIY